MKEEDSDFEMADEKPAKKPAARKAPASKVKDEDSDFDSAPVKPAAKPAARRKKALPVSDDDSDIEMIEAPSKDKGKEKVTPTPPKRKRYA